MEVENASILYTDATAVFTAETAPTKSAVCNHVNFQLPITYQCSHIVVKTARFKDKVTKEH